MGSIVLILVYIASAATFITGLKMLSGPETARKGNHIAGVGMALAIVATIFLYRDADGNLPSNLIWIFAALALGTLVGVRMARKVEMTAMPELVSFFNGMGGASAALISIIEFIQLYQSGSLAEQSNGTTLAILLAGLILGSVTFSGSVIAWGKLSGRIKDFAFRGQHILNLFILLLSLMLSVYICVQPAGPEIFWIFFVVLLLSLTYGVLFVQPIGGADMPVVISLLNSLSGISAATSGFLYDNKVILTGGILVGAAGTILTILMCKAMNRSLTNVLIGSFGTSQKQNVTEAGSYKEISMSDAAMMMSYASRVMIVPGYGLAVAQAQHSCHELERILEAKGVEVSYAIHPVAGRMPGHMNVLLAEADVSYDKLLEMEQANQEFERTDVVLILGANDVVNPAARTDPSSPIYGMPVLEVEKAKMVIVNKRSMKPGYAGIENALFYQPKTSMLFGDSKKAMQELISAVKSS